jgi:hypothetical protein
MKEVYYLLISLADREIVELSEREPERGATCRVGNSSVYEMSLAQLEDCSCVSCDQEVNLRFWLRQRNETQAKLRKLLAE